MNSIFIIFEIEIGKKPGSGFPELRSLLAQALVCHKGRQFGSLAEVGLRFRLMNS